MASLTQWLREVIAAQEWLTWAQPYVARAPDWALLTAPALIVLLVMWAVFRPRRKSQAEPNARLSHGTIAPVEPASRAPAPPATPSAPPPPPKVAAAPPEARASGIPADSDDNRAVRVFISSTFIDMEGERNVLVKQTFPALRTKFRARGVEFLEIDLRWGVTEEEVQSGKTLPICLAEVDRCRPYFVGLLGERYGSLLSQDNLTPELQEAFPVLREGVGRSLTEIEIMQGVLRNSESASRALFFQRDPAWLKTLSAQKRAQFETGDDADRAKLADLKARIRSSGARIIEYARPEDIGAAVEAALSELIEARFPEAEAPDAFTQTLRLHGAYARERRGLHIGAEPYLAALDQWMAKGDAPAMLITGASGGGKSTLVANWLHAWRKAHPKDIVFEQYLGASSDSADPILLMRRLWEHLNRTTGEIVDLPDGNAELMDVASGLAQRLAQANILAERKAGGILIALDGLDKLSSEQNLRWLTNVPRVKLVASSLDGEAKSAALARGWTALEVKPLSDGERGEFIERTLEGWGRKLLPEQIAAILAHAQAGNPLFLKTVLDELRVSATHARLDERLGVYLRARDMPELFARVLERLEADCQPGLVAKAMPLIWASRAGLEESEVIAIIGDKRRLAWAMLRNGLGDGLRDQAGRIAFSHDYLRGAVEARYLETDDKKRAAHLAIADRFDQCAADARQAEELPFQLRAAQAWERLETLLVDLNRFELLRARGEVELMSHWLPLKARGRDPKRLLCAAFGARGGDPSRWAEADIAAALALQEFLVFAGAQGSDLMRLESDCVAASERLCGPEHSDTLASMNILAATLNDSGDFGRAQDLFERVLDARSRLLGPEHPLTIGCMANLALSLRARGDLGGAQTLQERVLDARTRQFGPTHPSTLAVRNSLAVTLHASGKFTGARDLQEQTVQIVTRVYGPDHPETFGVMQNFASTLQSGGELAAAQAIQERVLDAQTRLLGPDHPHTLGSLNNLATTLHGRGTLAGAQDLYERYVECCMRLFGPEHASTVGGESNVALTLYDRGDFAGAQTIQERVLEVRTRLLGADHRDTLVATANLANTLRARDDFAGARELLERVCDVRARLNGPEHPLTVAAMNNLALFLFDYNDVARALEIFEHVLAVRSDSLGPDHLETVACLNNVAACRGSLGDFAGAQVHFERVLDTRERLLGPEHADTRAAASNLASAKAAAVRAGNRESGANSDLAQKQAKEISQLVEELSHHEDAMTVERLQQRIAGALPLLQTLQEREKVPLTLQVAIALGACGTALRALGQAEASALSFGEAATILRPIFERDKATFEELWRHLLRDMVETYETAGRSQEHILDALQRIAGNPDWRNPSEEQASAFSEGKDLVNEWTRARDAANAARSGDRLAALETAVGAISSFLAANKDVTLGPIKLVMERILREHVGGLG